MAGYDTQTDEELVFLLKESDERAMTEIFDRYWDKLLAVAMNRLQHLEEAEECVQDVFIKVWKLRDKLELKYTLNTYLSAAVRYRVIDTLDRQRKRIQYAADVLEEMIEISSADKSPEAHMLEKELIERIEATVKQLPEKCRIVYRMSREEGNSHKEIAQKLDISEKTVEAHLTRAIKDIRGNLTVAMPSILIWFSVNDIHHHF